MILSVFHLRSSVFICGYLLLVVSPLHALDPELRTPYHLEVVLGIADQRQLTQVFRDQVERELRDGLQVGLGAMGKVDVVPLRDHAALAKKIESKGLEALDGPLEIGDRKLHLVVIDFVDDQYVIRTRQIDGMTGLASPVRQARTADAQFVARTAALLIDRDFGLVGTLPVDTKAVDVKIAIKGSGLGMPISRWVRKGEVFAVVAIHKVGNQVRATRVPWALLQVTEEARPGDTLLSCRLYQRYRQSLAGGPSLLGYRCLKLGTSEAPLRVRMVDEKQRRPLPDQAVSIHRHGFESKPDEESSTDLDGFLTSKKSYAHVAFVQVYSGSSVRARIPIEIIDDRTMICPVSVSPEAEALGQLELHRRQWVGQLYENLLVVEALFKKLNEQVEKKDHPAALKSAQEGLAGIQADLAARTDEMRSLRVASQEQKLTLDLSEGEQRLQELQSRREELQKFTANLENVVKQVNDPKRMELLGMVERARLLEVEAEFGKAIELYKSIAEGAGDHVAVRDDALKQLARLQRAWQVKNAQHARARKFVYETWPKVEGAADLKERIEEAEKMFQACRDAGDLLTPRMLLKANLAHATKLKKRLESLQPRDNEDDRREAETIAALADQLKRLTEGVSAYLRPAK